MGSIQVAVSQVRMLICDEVDDPVAYRCSANIRLCDIRSRLIQRRRLLTLAVGGWEGCTVGRQVVGEGWLVPWWSAGRNQMLVEAPCASYLTCQPAVDAGCLWSERSTGSWMSPNVVRWMACWSLSLVRACGNIAGCASDPSSVVECGEFVFR